MPPYEANAETKSFTLKTGVALVTTTVVTRTKEKMVLMTRLFAQKAHIPSSIIILLHYVLNNKGTTSHPP